MMGEKRIIHSTMKKIHVGSVIGRKVNMRSIKFIVCWVFTFCCGWFVLSKCAFARKFRAKVAKNSQKYGLNSLFVIILHRFFKGKVIQNAAR